MYTVNNRHDTVGSIGRGQLRGVLRGGGGIVGGSIVGGGRQRGGIGGGGGRSTEGRYWGFNCTSHTYTMYVISI